MNIERLRIKNLGAKSHSWPILDIHFERANVPIVLITLENSRITIFEVFLDELFIETHIYRFLNNNFITSNKPIVRKLCFLL